MYDGFLYPHHYRFLHSYSERLGGSRSGLLAAGPPLYGAETTADHKKKTIRINTLPNIPGYDYTQPYSFFLLGFPGLQFVFYGFLHSSRLRIVIQLPSRFIIAIGST